MSKLFNRFRKNRASNASTTFTSTCSQVSTAGSRASKNSELDLIAVHPNEAFEAADSAPASSTYTFEVRHQPPGHVSSEDALPPQLGAEQPKEDPQPSVDLPSALPKSLTAFEAAEERLKDAAKNLEKIIPTEVLESEKLEIKGCADINTLADNIAVAIGRLMNKRNVEETKQSTVKTLMKGWVKKALPFVQNGLSATTVHTTSLGCLTDLCTQNAIPAPYGLIASGLLFIVQVCQTFTRLIFLEPKNHHGFGLG